MKILNIISIIALVCIFAVACSKNSQQEKTSKASQKTIASKTKPSPKAKKPEKSTPSTTTQKVSLDETKTKLFKDKLALVKKSLDLNQDQIKNIKENHTNFIASRKNCLPIAKKVEKATCLKDAHKKHWQGFVNTLSKEQKNIFLKHKKEGKLMLP